MKRISKILNNKGFTLVELLAVLVILAAIMGIALPSITSSMERTKEKQNEQKYKMLESFAEVYVADYKNAIYDELNDNKLADNSLPKCYINIKDSEFQKYLSDDADKDVDGQEIEGYIIFDANSNDYKFSVNQEGIKCK